VSILLLSARVDSGRLPYAPLYRTGTTQDECRCVPDQWEGVMTTSEHEFDLHDGRHRETGSHVRVYYDYANRKFATRDLITGRRSVADYAAVRLFRLLLACPPSFSRCQSAMTGRYV